MFCAICHFLCSIDILPMRLGHTLRGKPPGVARSLAQRLAGTYGLDTFSISFGLQLCIQPIDEDCVESAVSRPVDIGLPFPRPARSTELKKRLQYVKEQRKSTILEKSSREHKRK
jgi:large subunit ribosomal protein L38